MKSKRSSLSKACLVAVVLCCVVLAPVGLFAQENPTSEPQPSPNKLNNQQRKETPQEPKKPSPFVDRVVMFQQGVGGGKGNEKMPKIVLGPPLGAGKLKAGQDVLSLGEGGVIVLEFVDNEVFDGPGPDFIVFENPFLQAPGDDPDLGFFELAKVEVSLDGQNWIQFPFDTASRVGCAGHRPVIANAKLNKISPTNPKLAGGDAFDLKSVGLKVVRFVRITDVLSFGAKDGSAGFDLDAVAGVHNRIRKN
jgi:hypothetical protein